MPYVRRVPYSAVAPPARWVATIFAAGALLATCAWPISAAEAQQNRERYDVNVFSRVPNPPGLPEGIAVRGDLVYVGTNPGGNNPGPQTGQRSKVFAYNQAGKIVREYVIQGQDLTQVTNPQPAYGLQALAFDGDGVLYAVDKAPARIIRLNPQTGRQSDYVRFPDVPPCDSVPQGRRCSETATDLPAFPNYLAFAPDGSLYVSDFQQALIWRVPPGGGRARVAFTDRRLDSGMGPNGVSIMPGGNKLLFAQSQNPDGAPGEGSLFTLRIRKDGSAHRLRKLYESRPGDGPDGFAVGRSGRIYLNFFQANQVAVISPEGEVIRRIGQRSTGQNGTRIPFDSPASAAFTGERLLVTNHAVNTRNPNSFAVLDIAVKERGQKLFRPPISRSYK